MILPNRQLTDDERSLAVKILADAKEKITSASKSDSELEWAMRRYIYKQLIYGERKSPMVRRALKTKLRKNQNGLCSICGELLPEKGTILDRLEAMKGYVEENTRLLCPLCDQKVQQERKYT
jgi:ribosomal protein L44E